MPFFQAPPERHSESLQRLAFFVPPAVPEWSLTEVLGSWLSADPVLGAAVDSVQLVFGGRVDPSGRLRIAKLRNHQGWRLDRYWLARPQRVPLLLTQRPRRGSAIAVPADNSDRIHLDCNARRLLGICKSEVFLLIGPVSQGAAVLISAVEAAHLLLNSCSSQLSTNQTDERNNNDVAAC